MSQKKTVKVEDVEQLSASEPLEDDAIQCDSLRIESEDGEARLVVDHPRRGTTPYHELSEGERWRLAIKQLLIVHGSGQPREGLDDPV